MSDISALVLFADDIRTERGGKLIIIGSYVSDIVLDTTLPTVLPLFGLITVIGPPTTVVSQMHLSFFLNGIRFAGTNMDSAALQPGMAEHNRQMTILKGLQEDFGAIQGAILVHGYSRLFITLDTPTSILTAEVDIGYGPVSAGSIPIICGDGKDPISANTPSTPG